MLWTSELWRINHQRSITKPELSKTELPCGSPLSQPWWSHCLSASLLETSPLFVSWFLQGKECDPFPHPTPGSSIVLSTTANLSHPEDYLSSPTVIHKIRQVLLASLVLILPETEIEQVAGRIQELSPGHVFMPWCFQMVKVRWVQSSGSSELMDVSLESRIIWEVC